LVSKGIARARLNAMGMGEKDPIATMKRKREELKTVEWNLQLANEEMIKDAQQGNLIKYNNDNRLVFRGDFLFFYS
jgi:outer membrane protein OmpA-like peptidoglycan-associated protein